MRVHAPARSRWRGEEAGISFPPVRARLIARVRDP
jgi:hypothetical protein